MKKTFLSKSREIGVIVVIKFIQFNSISVDAIRVLDTKTPNFIIRFLLEFRIEPFTDIILVFEICLFGFPRFILPGTIIMSDAWRAYNVYVFL
ncbi:hypothetical protein QE152_g4165 [Popillia japonica]|uniref:Uncharacterized protein n=1 Tax=Popillia japonica TaxID=7064 RepID=A0AAW1N3L9_POPJA